jgi:hypothetical protein
MGSDCGDFLSDVAHLPMETRRNLALHSESDDPETKKTIEKLRRKRPLA